MSKFHSTVSRRHFMKTLGLAGAGLGAAAAAAPVFHDLDEVSADASSDWKRPWWVKHTDQPTAEVDWSIMPYFDSRETMFDRNAWKRVIGEDEYNRLNQLRGENASNWLKQGRPGFTLRDGAFAGSTGFGYAYGLVANWSIPVRGLEQRGGVSWSGTPEENMKMLRAAMRFYGARDVGVYELDSNTRKTVYSHESDGKAYTFESVDTAYEADSKRVIPNKDKYVVMFTTLESAEMMKRAPDQFSSASVSLGYAQGAIVCNRTQAFLSRIGYECLAEPSSNAIVQVAGGMALSGLAENARTSLSSLSPEFGPTFRGFKLITDLPLAPTKPIDAGMFKFCRTCKLCADACPPGAISQETEPSYDIQGPWNKPGIKSYYYHGSKCLSWWRYVTTGCSTCRAACPFTGKTDSVIHEMVKSVAATIPIFNGFFANMATVFGYEDFTDEGFSTREEKSSWWNIDNGPVYGFDTTRYTRKIS